MNCYQQAYFNLMTQSRENIFFISEHISSADRWNTRINMVMAIASSSSIGAWIIWQKFSWMWASIIAVSQVVGAVKVHLPFKKRLSTLYTLSNHLEQLCLEIEKDFFLVFNGDLSEREIYSKTMKYKTDKAGIEQKYLSGIVLPEDESILTKARKKNKVYFDNLCVGE